MGIGAFGPIDLRAGSPNYGYITSTPKQDWRYTDLVGPIAGELKLPVTFDTDVNAAALGEYRWGNSAAVGSLVYVTVGTGIGGGAVIEGRPLHGAGHPEMGHVRIPHDREAGPIPTVRAHTTGTASKGLPQAPPSRPDGVRPPDRCPKTIPPGTSRPSTLPTGSPISL